MTKVERLLINKGHYLDDTYHLVMDIVKVVDNLKDNVAERLDDAYAMCEEMFTAVEQCKADMVVLEVYRITLLSNPKLNLRLKSNSGYHQV